MSDESKLSFDQVCHLSGRYLGGFTVLQRRFLKVRQSLIFGIWAGFPGDFGAHQVLPRDQLSNNKSE